MGMKQTKDSTQVVGELLDKGLKTEEGQALAEAFVMGMTRRYAPFSLRNGIWRQTGPSNKSRSAANKQFDRWKIPGAENRIKEVRPNDPGKGWQRNRKEMIPEDDPMAKEIPSPKLLK